MTAAKAVLIFTAAIVSAYATLCFFADIDPGFQVSAIIAVLCLFAVICLDYGEWERRRDDVG